MVTRLSFQTLRRKLLRVSELKSSGNHRYKTTKSGHEISNNNKRDTLFRKKTEILPVWKRLGPITGVIEGYAQYQGKRPYLTQIVTSLVIFFAGDFSAQTINGGPYDFYHMIRTLIISAGSSIPTYEWLLFLGNHFNYPSKILSLAIKIVVNQVLFSPINNLWFFGMHSLMSGNTLRDVWRRVKDTVPNAVINSCKLWPPITAFSLTFVEPQYRFVFTAVIAIGWQTYLSLLNKKSELK